MYRSSCCAANEASGANAGDAGRAEDASQLAHRIQEEGASAGVESVLLASVARALRDKGVLDKQLKRAREVRATLF